jgi:hypothetical protein
VENHERRRIGDDIPPQWIRPSDVAVKLRAGIRGSGEEKRNVVGIQAIGCSCDKRPKRVATNEIAQAVWIIFGESWWHIHRFNSACLSPRSLLGNRARQYFVTVVADQHVILDSTPPNARHGRRDPTRRGDVSRESPAIN